MKAHEHKKRQHKEGHHAQGHKPAHHHSFEPARFAARWESPERDQEQRPAEVLKACGVSEGMSVADLGTGTGYFVPHLSRAVGAAGHVFALDAEPKMVGWVSERIKKEGLQNAEAAHVGYNSTTLAPTSVDRVLIVNVWHHIDEREAYLKHLVSRLKPNGALCVVEIKRDAPKGPPVKHRLSPQELVAELSKHEGLSVEASSLELPHQHLVVARLK